MEKAACEKLETQLNRLIQICDDLRKENYTLRQAHAHILQERDNTLEKNKKVQAKLETLLTRLQAMEE